MIDRVWVSGVRNLAEVKTALSPVTYVSGANNQGKTNFLEGIFFALTGKPVSGGLVDDLRAFDRRGVGAVGVGMSNPAVSVYRKISEPRDVFINQKKSSGPQVSRYFLVEYWSAELIRSIQDSPDERRRLVHRFCAAAVPEFGQLWRDYSRVLAQRNAALKAQNGRAAHLYAGRVAELAERVVHVRGLALGRLGDAVTALFQTLDGYAAQVNVDQVCRHVDMGAYRESLLAYFDTQGAKEMALGYTTAGPHRDDVVFVADGQDVVRFLSRGMNRVLAILIHLAIFQLRRDASMCGLLLLDDVFSEIASVLARRVLQTVVASNQVVVAATDVSDFQKAIPGLSLHVTRGLVEVG